MSTWRKLESARLVRPHQTSADEIRTQLEAVERHLQDADVPGLSDDGRFVMTYSAVFRLATVALFASGYQPHGDDHHKTTFSAIPLALGPRATFLADYFDRCRRKRNNIQYDQVNVATKSEADEIRLKATEFKQLVFKWLKESHPKLLP